MVHTAKFYYILNQQDKQRLMKMTNQSSVNLALTDIDSHFPGISSRLSPKFEDPYLDVSVNFIDLLGKADIHETDLTTIIDMLSHYTSIVLNTADYRILTLTKLEYRFDVCMTKEDRELIFNLCRKTIDKAGFYKKHSNYSTTAYFQSKSIAATVYDKEQERLDTKKPLQAYEKDILRYEVRLNSRHFSYMKTSTKWNLERDLANYFKEDLYRRYFKLYFKNFLFTSHYHSYESATKLIKDSSETDLKKTKTIDFISSANRHGLTITKKNFKKGKYSRHVSFLEQLNVSPLIIAKAQLGTRDFLFNPLSIFK